MMIFNICRVSLIITCSPQFQIQDEVGLRGGISPISHWYTAPTVQHKEMFSVDGVELDPIITGIMVRVGSVLGLELTGTELHDLTCFVLHKLLLLPALAATDATATAISECLRYAAALFMLLLHGTTYYSHHELTAALQMQLKGHLRQVLGTNYIYSAAGIWILSIGMAISNDSLSSSTEDIQWFTDQAYVAKSALGLHTWEDVLSCLEKVLWVRTWQHGAGLVRQGWDEVL